MHIQNIQNLAKENNNFRKVLSTGVFAQLVLMSLKPGEDIGLETHPNTDQLFFIVSGQGEIEADGKLDKVWADSFILVPAGTEHNLKNAGQEDLKLYTIYAPPAHAEDEVQPTKNLENKY